MRIAVIGAGAVGGYFGGRLAESGQEVVFVARGAHLDALRDSGLRVESPLGDIQLRHVDATDTTDQVGKVDIVIVAVKAWQVPNVAPSIRPLIGDHTSVLPLQNGVEAAELLINVLGEGTVLGGMCRILSTMAGPGHIKHLGLEPVIALGELDNVQSERVAQISETIRGAGVTTQNPPDIHVAIWQKFLFIAAVSGLGAVTRAPFGILRSLPETRELLDATLREIHAVAIARGVAVPLEAVVSTLEFIDKMPADATASMQRDIMEGRPSELESQNGAVVRLGRESGVETPINSFIYASLLPMEMQARN